MKKIFITLAIVAAFSMGACNFFGNQTPDHETEVQTDTLITNEWVQVDSLTMHYNFNDSTCISMTLEDNSLCFEGNGIGDLQVFQRVDSTVYDIPVEEYGFNTWRLQLDTLKTDQVKHLLLTVDELQSIELDLEF